MTSPETLFCKILEYQFNTKITEIESVLLLPLKGIRDIKSNISRVEKLVFSEVKTEIESIEALLIEVLFLDKISSLAAVENFCQIAFSCQKLVETLVDASSGYLSFLDTSTRSLVSASYPDFEKYVCVLGLRNIVGLFTTDILGKLKTKLITLRDSLDDNLRLTEMQDRYLAILESSGIFVMLDDLRKYLRCGFSICNYAATASNKLADYMDKLALRDTGTSWDIDLGSLLDKYNDVSDEITNKIDQLIEIIDNRGFDRNIPRDQVMIG